MDEQDRFHHECEVELNADTYAEIYSRHPKAARRLRRFGILLIAILCLFWSYTLIPGLVLLALLAIATFMPTNMPKSMKTGFQTFPNLHVPIQYGMSENIMWVRSSFVEQSSNWDNLATWSENDKWFRLAPHGAQQLFFRIEQMKEAGVYEAARRRAEASAPEFGKPSSRAV